MEDEENIVSKVNIRRRCQYPLAPRNSSTSLKQFDQRRFLYKIAPPDCNCAVFFKDFGTNEYMGKFLASLCKNLSQSNIAKIRAMSKQIGMNS